ncbi:MAG: hypothetical protein OEY78_00475 [Gammaproteobacteria bacterium]|nr:hypothetical protein [Gammaproteobacteria bacterium]
MVFAFLYLSIASLTHADLYITDDYLKGLDAELKNAEKEQATSNTTENQKTTAADINKAVQSRFNFENLLRTKHQTSFVLYTKLSTSDRILIYEQFKSSKNIAQAKQTIIKKFESR